MNFIPFFKRTKKPDRSLADLSGFALRLKNDLKIIKCGPHPFSFLAKKQHIDDPYSVFNIIITSMRFLFIYNNEYPERISTRFCLDFINPSSTSRDIRSDSSGIFVNRPFFEY